jgi:DNA-binding MarR family transcriptional regulator
MENEVETQETIGSLITKSYWYLKTYFNKLLKENEIGITTEQFSVMMAVYTNSGITQSEIAQMVIKDKTNITRIIDLLEKSNFIRRKRDRNDRRIYRIYLTQIGNTILKKVFPITEQVDKNGLSNLKINQISELKKSLAKVRETYKELIDR